MSSDFLTSASVSIWNTDVTLTCPGDDEVEWHKGKERYHTDKDLILKDYTDKNEGLYYCSYKTGEDDNKVKITQYFYIKAKGKCRKYIKLIFSSR